MLRPCFGVFSPSGLMKSKCSWSIEDNGSTPQDAEDAKNSSEKEIRKTEARGWNLPNPSRAFGFRMRFWDGRPGQRCGSGWFAGVGQLKNSVSVPKSGTAK